MRQTSFDQADREKMRAAILAFAKQNKLGAPSLQLRIAEATKRSADQIPLKTLQRFLKDEGRTNDGFMIPIAEFVASVGAITPLDTFAHELGAFFARSGTEKEAANEVPARFARTYEIVAGSAKFKNIKVIRSGAIENPDEPYGRCVISGTGLSLKVQELETGSGTGGVDGAFRPPANEGVVLYFAPLLFMLLRNNLTRLPRVYWLREQEDGKLVGHAMHSIPLEPGSIQVPYSELRNHELHPAPENMR